VAPGSLAVWKEQRGRDQAFSSAPLQLAGAKQAIADGKATFEDHLVLRAHSSGASRTLVWEHFEKAGWPPAAGLLGSGDALERLRRAGSKVGRRRPAMARPSTGGPQPPDQLFSPNALGELFLPNSSRPGRRAAGGQQMLGLLTPCGDLRPKPAHLKPSNWSQRRAIYPSRPARGAALPPAEGKGL
jgi:hypothetical protein